MGMLGLQMIAHMDMQGYVETLGTSLGSRFGAKRLTFQGLVAVIREPRHLPCVHMAVA